MHIHAYAFLNSGVGTKSTLRGQGELEARRAEPGQDEVLGERAVKCIGVNLLKMLMGSNPTRVFLPLLFPFTLPSLSFSSLPPPSLPSYFEVGP